MSKRFETLIDKVDNFIDARLPQSPEAIKNRRNHLLIPLGIVAAGAALVVGTHELGEAVDHQLDHTEKIGQEYSHQNQQDRQQFQQDLDSGTIRLDR